MKSIKNYIVYIVCIVLQIEPKLAKNEKKLYYIDIKEYFY
ncbi:hypothetical protein X474_04905 [Dethiosulfatarculus sandiegensis]|uniref:Uncharacterized protein n=1 Tax=Dethiosulfatarculus sandiegensis TaxID=1429043 RepID=A0A0D2HY23_9BACT|nr:hypothetical protein X474_04905 [Dethiosulfatarculus sandiegensis]